MAMKGHSILTQEITLKCAEGAKEDFPQERARDLNLEDTFISLSRDSNGGWAKISFGNRRGMTNLRSIGRGNWEEKGE